MATRVESTRNLVTTQSIAFIRQISLSITMKAARPLTRMNIYFDGVDVNHLCQPSGGNIGDSLITDANGELSCVLHIPPGTFTTGEKSVYITDAPSFDIANLEGSTFGSARGVFRTNGTLQFFQRTTTTVNLVDVVTVIGSDPLAQSFFTYGKTGGVFVTSIDLFFNTKDPEIPVRVDIRRLINGYPDSLKSIRPERVATLTPDKINISNDASAATTFTFDTPIYLEEESEYCFVVYSNSKLYNLFTSKLGEESFETGKTIFDQPYVGSLFKSENDVTWTAEQFEDMKFRMRIAKYDTTSSAILNFKVSPGWLAIPGVNFSTTNGSGIVRLKTNLKHGLEQNSIVKINGSDNAIYNGIPSANFTGAKTITNVVDEYTVEYNAVELSTATGPVVTGGQVTTINVNSGGSGYTSAPTVSFNNSGTGGTGAQATARINAIGQVVALDITDPGSGYTSAPTVQFDNTGTGGTGAFATAYIESVFAVLVNKPVHFINPIIPATEIVGTKIAANVSTTQLNYPGGNLNSYQLGEVLDLNYTGRTGFNVNSVIVSPQNETQVMGGNDSMILQYVLTSTNPNVSPVINIRNNPSVYAYSYRLNNQLGEDIEGVTNSELNPSTGNAESRYFTRKFVLSTPSRGINLFSEIYSEQQSNVDWYIRTSLSASGIEHDTLDWKLLTCDVDRNRSTRKNQFLDYKFYLFDISEFDTYDLKCVLRSSNPIKAPIVKNYRAIIVV